MKYLMRIERVAGRGLATPEVYADVEDAPELVRAALVVLTERAILRSDGSLRPGRYELVIEEVQ